MDADDDDGAERGAELTQCPYCEGRSCPHQVLWFSREGGAWIGLLPEATGPVEARLAAALAALFRAGGPVPRGAGLELQELLLAARESFDGSVESLEGPSAMQDYFTSLARTTAGAAVVEVDWEDDGPGGGDAVVHAFFKAPTRGVRSVLAAARRDLGVLKRAVGELKPRAKRRTALPSRRAKRGRTRSTSEATKRPRG